MGQTNGVTGTSDANGFEHTTVSKLLRRALSRHEHRLRRVVRFDATNVIRIRLLHALNQLAQLLLELLTDRLLLGSATRRVRGRAPEVFAGLDGIRILDELRRSCLEHVLRGDGNLVLVLFHKVGIGAVFDETGKVADAKEGLGLLDFRRMKASVFRNHHVLVGKVLFVHANGKVAIATFRQATFVIEDRQNAQLGSLDRIETVLIVWKLDERPFNVLRLVLGLFELEDELIELLLQGFVGVVDAKLLERVDRETLETKDIQDTTRRSNVGIILPTNARIDLVDDPQKESPVDRLGQGVSRVRGLFGRQLGLDFFPTRQHDAFRERATHLVAVDTEQLGGVGQTLFVFDFRRLVPVYFDFLELDLAQMQETSNHGEDRVNRLLRPAQFAHGLDRVLESGLVREFPQMRGPALSGVVKVVGQVEAARDAVVKFVLVVVLFGTAAQELVKNVVVALSGRVKRQAHLFQQVRLHLGAHEVSGAAKAQLDEFSKAGRVVVAERPGVAKGFEDGIRLQHALHDGAVVFRRRFHGRISRSQRRQIEHDDLGRFRFSGSGFSRNENGLRLAVIRHHLAVTPIGNRKHVRLQIVAALHALGRQQSIAAVGFEDFVRVQFQALKGIDRNEDGTSPRVDFAAKKSIGQGMQNRRFVQMRKRN